jgi:hypothetical protein
LPEDLQRLRECQTREIGVVSERREQEFRALVQELAEITGQRKSRQQALTTLSLVGVLGVANSASTTEAVLSLVLMGILAGVASFVAGRLLLQMRRRHLKGLWASATAMALAVAIAAASIWRLIQLA